MDKKEILKKAIERRLEKSKRGELRILIPVEKAKQNPTSLRCAINAKCYECNGGENWKNRTRYCQIFDCPLWPVRPYGKGITKEQCEAWREYP